MGLYDVAVCSESQFNSICPSPSANPRLCIWQSPPQHNRAFFMLYGWCDTESYSSFINSLPYIDPLIWVKDFNLWFVSLKEFILLFYHPVFVHVGRLKPFDIVLLPQQWSLDSNSAINASFIESSPHSGCWQFFSWYWFSLVVMFGAVNLLSHKLVMKLSSALVAAFGFVFPVSWNHLTV